MKKMLLAFALAIALPVVAQEALETQEITVFTEESQPTPVEDVVTTDQAVQEADSEEMLSEEFLDELANNPEFMEMLQELEAQSSEHAADKKTQEKS